MNTKLKLEIKDFLCTLMILFTLLLIDINRNNSTMEESAWEPKNQFEMATVC